MAKQIKKLSDAIIAGAEIARKRGIKKGKGNLIRLDAEGNVCEACALGMAILATCGDATVKKVAEGKISGYNLLDKKFKSSRLNSCLANLVKKVKKGVWVENLKVSRWVGWTNKSVLPDVIEPAMFVYTINDRSRMTPEQIAEKLKSCDL